MSKILADIKLYKNKIAQVVVSGACDGMTFNINNAKFSSGTFSTIKKVSTGMVGSTTVEAEAASKIKANYQSLNDLINNYEKLTMIKNQVNTEVTVSIGGKRYTIAQVLAVNTSVTKEFKKSVISALKRSHNETINTITMYNNQKFDQNTINDYIESRVSRNPDGALNRDEVEFFTKKYNSENEIDIVDPLDIVNLIDKLQNEYDQLYGDIDYRLSEVNARLMIEYDLDEEVPTYRILNLNEIAELEAMEDGTDEDPFREIWEKVVKI